MANRTIILLVLLVGVAAGAVYFRSTTETDQQTTAPSPPPSYPDGPETVADLLASIEDLGELPQFKTGFTIDQAYRSIPHRRTVFDFETGALSEVDEEYLDIMFTLIDEGVRLRVYGSRRGQRDNDVLGFVIDGYDEIYTYIEALQPPGHLSAYHQQILAAFEYQKTFFEDARSNGSGFKYWGKNLARHKSAKAASRALIQAYHQLKSKFPKQDKHNLEAFFDYHCALDFM